MQLSRLRSPLYLVCLISAAVGCGDDDDASAAAGSGGAGTTATAGKSAAGAGGAGKSAAGSGAAGSGAAGSGGAGKSAAGGGGTGGSASAGKGGAGAGNGAGSGGANAGTSASGTGGAGGSGAAAGSGGSGGAAGSEETIPELNGCTTYEDHSGASDSRTIAIAPSGNIYSPKCITIAVGQTVTWEGSLSGHPLAPGNASDANAGSDDNPIEATNSGQSVEFTFSTAGTFPYYCTYHSTGAGLGMAGSIHVR